MSLAFSIGWFVFLAVIAVQYPTTAFDDNKEVISKRFLDVVINGGIGGVYINSNGNNNNNNNNDVYGSAIGGVFVNSNGNNNNNNKYNGGYGGIYVNSNGNNNNNNNGGYGVGVYSNGNNNNMQGTYIGTSLSNCDNLLIINHQNNVNISATSTHSHCAYVQNYRLNATGTHGSAGGWCAHTGNTDQYVEISFSKQYTFRGIITQGRHGGGQWVTQYRVSYSTNCVRFHRIGKLYAANWDENTAVTNMFTNPVRGRCIRIIPTKYHTHISMRFDIIGCEV